MRKKYYWLVLGLGIICSIYILMLEAYSRIPAKLSFIEKRLEDEITFDEIGILISGRCYGEALSQKELAEKANEMGRALSHQDTCSRFCKLEHGRVSNFEILPIDGGNLLRMEGEDTYCSYVFTIKNQKDIHQNSYYQFKLTGKEDAYHVDQLKAYANDLLDKWCSEKAKEFIYFAGDMTKLATANEKAILSQAIFDHLDAARTNFYADEVEKSTCSYYGYCPYIDDYYKEESGFKSNMQIAFNDNEIEGQTKVRVAFPFYNEVF